MTSGSRDNWFERNPRKTIIVFAVFALAIFLSIIYATEKYLAHKNQGIGYNFALKNRAITLREYSPLLSEYNRPGPEDDVFDTVAKKDYLLRVDKNGFIRPSEIYSNPDISVVFLGDSATACLFVEEKNRFPYAVGRLLEKEFKLKVNSYNASRTANHTMHSIDILLNKIIPIKPDIIVMMHANNDAAFLLYEKSYWNDSPTRGLLFDTNDNTATICFRNLRDKLIPNIAREFRLMRIKAKTAVNANPNAAQVDEFAKMRGKKITYDSAALREQFEMNLQTFISICKIRNITPVLMTMASRFKDNPDKAVMDRFNNVAVGYQEYKQLFDLFNESIRKIARENNILVIDLAAAIPPEKEYIYDVIHYNDRGSLQAAEVISDKLKPLVQELLARKQPQHLTPYQINRGAQ